MITTRRYTNPPYLPVVIIEGVVRIPKTTKSSQKLLKVDEESSWEASITRDDISKEFNVSR